MNMIRVMTIVGGAVLATVFLFDGNIFTKNAMAGAPAPAAEAVASDATDAAKAIAADATTEMVFEAQTLKGEVVNIGDQIGKGKWSLVMFWQVDCTVCRQQEPIISEFHEKYKDTNAEVIGITIDGMEKIDEINNFLAGRDLSYPNYVGDLGMMAFNYEVIAERGFRGTPTYLLFNPAGELMGDN